MYTTLNFKTKKALKEAVKAGMRVTLSPQGVESSVRNGIAFVEGPHYPSHHTWSAEVTVKNGIVVAVK